jgi:hypothetical protein
MYSTVPSSSRLLPGAFSQLQSVHTFGDLSNFLRNGIADEDSRILSDSMQQLALHAEGVVAGLRMSRHRSHAAPILMDMLTVLRDHRGTVANLGLAWRGLYEFGAYLHALDGFRVLIGQWLLCIDRRNDEVTVTPEEFALLSWRTLGEGMLLVDMYEQWLEREGFDGAEPVSDLGKLPEPQAERGRQWWQKLRR